MSLLRQELESKETAALQHGLPMMEDHSPQVGEKPTCLYSQDPSDRKGHKPFCFLFFISTWLLCIPMVPKAPAGERKSVWRYVALTLQQSLLPPSPPYPRSWRLGFCLTPFSLTLTTFISFSCSNCNINTLMIWSRSPGPWYLSEIFSSICILNMER